MFAVIGDDEVGVGGERASRHVIVVGIVGNDARHVEGLDQFDGLDVIGYDVCSGATDEGQLFVGGRSRQDIGEFFEQHGAAIELAAGLLAKYLTEVAKKWDMGRREVCGLFSDLMGHCNLAIS